MSRAQLNRLFSSSKPSALFSKLSQGRKLYHNNFNFSQLRNLHALPSLPFDHAFGLEPSMSLKTTSLVYADFLDHWVGSLNKMVDGTPYESKSLLETIKESSQSMDTRILYNTASQVWNSTFCLTALALQPNPINDTLHHRLREAFGSYEGFVKELHTHADALFGGGFIWLMVYSDGTRITVTPNAENPIYPFSPPQTLPEKTEVSGTIATDVGKPTEAGVPLLGINMWGYSYILDHGLDKHAYIDALLKNVDWKVVYERSIQNTLIPKRF